jgi:hypothetical protein
MTADYWAIFAEAIVVAVILLVLVPLYQRDSYRLGDGVRVFHRISLIATH